MSVYKAPWCRALWVVSAVATVILLGVTALPVPGPWWARVLPLGILAGALPFVVRGYELREDLLLIRRLCWDTRIELAELKSARFDPAAMCGSIRTCGNGGLFSITGWYWNKRLKTYRAYATDPARGVVLTFDTRRIVVTPESPEAFVRELSARCPPGGDFG